MGCPKKDQLFRSCSSCAEKFPEITWVSARIEGTRLILNIQEGIIPQKTNSNTSPCNLLADKDGVITDMIVRRGIPVKKPGDSCKKGELLVSGELHIMNDSQEVLRKEYVHADADIFISRQISYYQEFPLNNRTKSLAGKRKRNSISGLALVSGIASGITYRSETYHRGNSSAYHRKFYTSCMDRMDRNY